MNGMAFTNQRYESLRKTPSGQRLPLAFVDLDVLDASREYAAALARGTGKSLRIGTQSIGCLR